MYEKTMETDAFQLSARFVIANDAARSQMDRYKSGNSAIYQAFGMSMTRRQLNKLINFK